MGVRGSENVRGSETERESMKEPEGLRSEWEEEGVRVIEWA